MSIKVLSVDDSKAVRIIVKKTLKPYDVEIVEATNGVEGLAAAAKESPDIILLDVTMPVMDGVEMLTKLKSDAALKGIPVIMLTAEAGRENIMKIAKIGVRDYVVKPFKEENLIEKISRVVDLQAKSDDSAPKKKSGDGFDFLVVEDKPAIIKQIEDGLPEENWRVHGFSDTQAAIDFCGKTLPDMAILSLSLPEDGALSFFRFMRSNNDLKFVPVFGLAVKSAEEEIARAQQAGITQIVTKPIDFRDLENRIVKALKVDVSGKYFKFEEEMLVVKFPADTMAEDVKQIDAYLKAKVSDAVDNGFNKVLFDLAELKGMDMSVITLIANAIEHCKEMTMKTALLGNDIVIAECSGIEDSTDWTFAESRDEAKASMG